jgi:hypothetical protein
MLGKKAQYWEYTVTRERERNAGIFTSIEQECSFFLFSHFKYQKHLLTLIHPISVYIE